MKIKEGSKVKAHYTGKLDDGKVFDTSEGKEPIEFTVGEGKIIKGFEQGIIGMEKGEKKTIKIEAKDAYGERNDQLMQQIPKDKLPQDVEAKEGMVLTFKSPDGQMFNAVISKVEEDKVTVDLNHPLAGKNLNFDIEIVEVA